MAWPGNDGGFNSATNEFSYVSDFLDTFENAASDDVRLAELATVITPRAFATPSSAYATPFGALDRKASPGPTDLYSPGGGTLGRGDKPTPLRLPNGAPIEAIETPTTTSSSLGSAGGPSVYGNGHGSTPSVTASAIGTRTLSEDMNAVQGASSLLSLRSGLPVPVPNAKTHERFLLTAADPIDGNNDEARLLVVLQAKYEAGLLKPYDYGAAYARFQRYMETSMSAVNRQRVQTALSTFRPAFQAMAQSLTDMEVIRVEESFERLLMDYARVFSSLGVPACLWRRTGEICKLNKEFALLVDVPYERFEFKDPASAICIYELMSEESAVNYWEKYANIAFDETQKAVLSTCVLKDSKGGLRPCSFSFTIRRDRYNLPFCLVGNFLPV